MKISQPNHNRKSIRLREYDYSSPGIYFVTICVHNKKYLFGKIIDGEMELNEFGKIIEQQWLLIPQRFNIIQLDKFIIMPNHLHGIIQIVGAGFPCPLQGFPRPSCGFPRHKITAYINCDNNGRGNRAPTLGQMVAFFKYQSTKYINILHQTPGAKLWQRNYYEHIIRNEISLNNIRTYIINNPNNWILDKLNCEHHGD